jgi:DNA-binding CsgD family transcriptional regulator
MPSPQYDTISKIKNIHTDFCKDVDTICKPLYMIGINYFHFVRSYKDKSRISLSNNKLFSEYYYDKCYYLQPAIAKVPNINKSACYLWLSLKNNIIFQDLSNLFDIDNGITIIRNFVNYSDYYYFGSRPGNVEINNLYLVKLKLLERFIAYFTDSATSLIHYTEKHRIVIPALKNILEPISPPGLVFNNINLIEDFEKNTPIKHYRVNDGLQENIFSARQMDCIVGILDGKTAKDISLDLNLSVRTVENYLNNIKFKLGCSKKNDLIKKLKELISYDA